MWYIKVIKHFIFFKRVYEESIKEMYINYYNKRFKKRNCLKKDRMQVIWKLKWP